jgi:hypothetical protein
MVRPLSETIFSPLPLRAAEISSVGGVWIFSGTTHYSNLQQVHYKSYKDFSLALALPIEGFI